MQRHFNAEVTKGKQHAKKFEAEQILGDLGWTFCIVRNPWDYCVSWYMFKQNLVKTYIKELEEDPSLAMKKPKRYNKEGLEGQLQWFTQGFGNWVKQTKRKPQSRWAKDCNYVMKLENLEEDFKNIQEILNCYEPLPLINKTESKEDYRKYYDDESIAIVEEKFKQDIINFNYTFD